MIFQLPFPKLPFPLPCRAHAVLFIRPCIANTHLFVFIMVDAFYCHDMYHFICVMWCTGVFTYKQFESKPVSSLASTIFGAIKNAVSPKTSRKQIDVKVFIIWLRIAYRIHLPHGVHMLSFCVHSWVYSICTAHTSSLLWSLIAQHNDDPSGSSKDWS